MTEELREVVVVGTEYFSNITGPPTPLRYWCRVIARKASEEFARNCTTFDPRGYIA
jgi:hypothetical protein